MGIEDLIADADWATAAISGVVGLVSVVDELAGLGEIPPDLTGWKTGRKKSCAGCLRLASLTRAGKSGSSRPCAISCRSRTISSAKPCLGAGRSVSMKSRSRAVGIARTPQGSGLQPEERQPRDLIRYI